MNELHDRSRSQLYSYSVTVIVMTDSWHLQPDPLTCQRKGQ
jgi:hypothetical protein